MDLDARPDGAAGDREAAEPIEGGRAPAGDREPGGSAGGDPAAELAAAMADLAQQRAAYLRLAADLDNFRKRKAQEMADSRRYGGEPLLVAILPALDNLSRAVEHLPADGEDQLAAGLRLTLRQLEEALASQGIVAIPAVGMPFDPSLHEAVASEPGSGGPVDTVVAELRRGYRYHDRVVRPAQVRVARAAGPLDSATAPEGAG